MRSRKDRQTTAKSAAPKSVMPFVDNLTMTAISCQCRNQTWTVGLSDTGRIGIQCQKCRFVGEIVAEGLTTVKKVA